MESLHDRVAAAVHTQYSLLGPTAKPQTGEWTVLAGIVLSRPTGSLDVVALATGTKCLSIDAIAADVHGEAIHDSHAEVSARRAVLLYLYKQLQLIGEGREDESILCRLSSDRSRPVTPTAIDVGCEPFGVVVWVVAEQLATHLVASAAGITLTKAVTPSELSFLT